MMRELDVVILGAGMAGLGAGVEAQRRGLDSLIIEAAPAPGGLCRGITVAGCDFDRYGPKVMVERPTAAPLVELLGGAAQRHQLHEVVYLAGLGLLGFPVQRHLVDLPPDDRATVLAEIAAARRTHAEVKNYRDWLLAAYGPFLCERILFPYEEKKWQMPLEQMDYRWAQQRPVAVSDQDILAGSQVRLPPWRTYVYPREGNLSQLVAALVEGAGPMVLDAPVTAIDLPGRTVTANGRTYRYKHLVSSIALDQAVAMTRGLDAGLAAASAGVLRWLSIRVYNLVFDGTLPLTGDAVYFPEPSVGFRRVANLQNLCPGLPAPGRTAISVETAIGTSPARGVDEVVAELRSVPQFRSLGPLLGSDTVDIAHAYPLQRDGLQEHVALLVEAYRRWNVHHCGRAGTFNYCDMDIAYDQGGRAVRTAVEGEIPCSSSV